MSQTILVLRCVNVDCGVTLSEFEIQKISLEKRATPKYHFCRGCRRNRSGIEWIYCIGCNSRIHFNGQRIKCDGCTSRARCISSKKKKRSEADNMSMIMQVLRANSSANMGMLVSFLERDWKTIVKFVSQLRKKGETILYNKITEEYYL